MASIDVISNDFLLLSVGDGSSKPSTIPASRRVSPVHDVFTDDEHRLLNAKIKKCFSAFRKWNEEPDLSSLLSQIIMDKRLTTLTTDEAEEMINQQPFFEVILRSVWHARLFKEVRQLGAFAVENMHYYQINVA